MKFDGDFVLAGNTLGNVIELNFESTIATNIETKNGSVELCCTPIPTFQTNILTVDRFLVIVGEKLTNLLLIGLFKSSETMQKINA